MRENRGPGSPLFRWEYAQEKQKGFAVRVEIVSLAALPAADGGKA